MKNKLTDFETEDAVRIFDEGYENYIGWQS